MIGKDKRPENRGLPLLVQASMDEHRRQYRRLEQDIDDNEDGPAFRPSPETDRYPSAAASRFYVHEASQELRDTLLVHDDREMQADLIVSGEAYRRRDRRRSRRGRRQADDSRLDRRDRAGRCRFECGKTRRFVSRACPAVTWYPEYREARKLGAYRFELQVTKLINGPRKGDGTVLPATSPKLKKQTGGSGEAVDGPDRAEAQLPVWRGMCPERG